MGTALYIALEKKIPDVDTMIDGKMLSKAEEHLAKSAERLGVRPLMDFFSTSADEAADLLGEDVAGIDIPAAQWFSAEDGLSTVDALLAEAATSSELKAAQRRPARMPARAPGGAEAWSEVASCYRFLSITSGLV